MSTQRRCTALAPGSVGAVAANHQFVSISVRTLRCPVLSLLQRRGRIGAAVEGETSLKTDRRGGVLGFDDVDETQKKQGGEEIQHPVSSECAAGAAGEQLQKSVAGESEAEAVGDGPGKRDGGDGEEGRDADLGIVPFNLAEAGEHEAADEDERGGGGEAGNGSDQR